ncbi:polyprenol monophosphomannose synthase [Haloglycomyces albus]|uniref:polyprenol monophosphomannose synthase n=1 Tax=Haloglycomyces albus TaxID=526067 RepID=UPI00046C9454|nr:polyprenol monophosphomannose synthase [Haloglycomyces albus]
MRRLVIIPTYNETATLEPIVRRTRRNAHNVDVLIVDDNSPDGTGRLADRLSAADPAVHVLHRSEKTGLAGAYLAGFAWAVAHDYHQVAQMDADGSHNPADLPRLFRALAGSDVAIGSRYVPGGGVLHWPWHRRGLSRAASVYTRGMLGISTKDVTAGFRAWRTDSLYALNLDTVESVGYCFQIDLTRRAVQAGQRIVEIPIVFTERRRGTSKMTPRIAWEAVRNVSRWGWSHRTQQLRPQGRRS